MEDDIGKSVLFLVKIENSPRSPLGKLTILKYLLTDKVMIRFTNINYVKRQDGIAAIILFLY